VRVCWLFVGCLLVVCNEYIDYHKIKFMIIRKKFYIRQRFTKKTLYVFFFVLVNGSNLD